MSDNMENKQEESYSFLRETLKDEQVKPKKVVGSFCRIAGKGLVFGLAACLAFCAIRPWAEAIFARGTDVVTIPEDEELNQDELQNQEEDPAKTALDNYREMASALTDVAKEASKSVVEVKAVSHEVSLENLGQDPVSVSGVIAWKNSGEVLVVAPARILDDSEADIEIKFNDGRTYEARLKKQDKNSQLAVFSVVTPMMSESTRNHIKAATFGNSNVLTKGDSVIALGNQFGYSGGSGYGIISTVNNYITVADRTYRVVTTDIAAAENGSGILFNAEGEVIGLGDQQVVGGSSKNLVAGYAISGIKDVIELLSNGEGVPYIGINGIEVTEELSNAQGIPRGIYVKGIESNSPAMQAGIQNGDIVVSVGEKSIKTLYALGNALSEYKVGDHVEIVVQRQGAEEYVEVPFDVTIGSKE